MRAVHGWALWLAIVAAGTAVADEPAITVRTQPTITAVGVPFNIIVHTRGTPLGKITLPSADYIEIATEPVAETRTFAYEHGQTFVISETRFAALATAPGTLTIPPIQVVIAGQRLVSEAVQIEVLPQQSPPPVPNEPPKDRAIPIDEAFFIRTGVDKHEVYQGEAVLLSLELWCVQGVQAHPRRGSAMTPPDTTGFYAISLPATTENRQRKLADVAYLYEVQQTRRMLFPTATGELTIGGWYLEGEIRVPDQQRPHSPFGRLQPRPLKAEPVKVTVKPLPGRPDGFSGAVGQFSLKSSLSSQSTRLGQPVTLVAQVSGMGNPDAIGAPRVPAVQGLHVSPPRSSTEVHRSEKGLRVDKRFEFTLTPNEMGDLTLPPVSFVYFDPEREDFITLEGREFPVRVGRPDTVATRTFVSADDPEAQRLALLAEDITPPLPPPATLARRAGAGYAVLAAGYVLPVVAYAGLAAFLYRRRRFAADQALARAHLARSRMQQRLGTIDSAREPAVVLYRALCGYVADMLNTPDTGMTPEDLEDLCAAHGIPHGAFAGVEKTLRACERVRYARGRLSANEVQALVEAVEVNLELFDTALKEARS